MQETKEGNGLITQKAWCARSMPAKPCETGARRFIAKMLKRFIMAKPKVDPLIKGNQKKHTADGLKRMEQLALLLWALTAKGSVVGVTSTKLPDVRALGDSMVSLTDKSERAIELFKEGRPISSGASFLQTHVEGAAFIMRDGGSLDTVLPCLCYQAVFLWLLAGYAQLKEEECDPENYGFANVRLAKDTAWEWVAYLGDVIELVSSLQYQRA